MSLTDRVKAAIIRQILDRGIFDAKRLITIDIRKGTFNISNVRSVVMGIHDFAVLHNAVERLAGRAGPIILRTQGEESGRIDAQKAWRRNFEEFNLKFEPSMVISLFPTAYASFGWGRMITKEMNPDTGVGTLIIEDCFEADAILEVSGVKDMPQCHFVAGYLKGFLSEITGRKLQVRETKCKAAGDDHCEFQITLTQ